MQIYFFFTPLVTAEQPPYSCLLLSSSATPDTFYLLTPALGSAHHSALTCHLGTSGIKHRQFHNHMKALCHVN